jgi:threonine aldolase
MREAIFRADVGDDVLGEDPTINRLEEKAAALLGKQAALYVPSGTFGNQCSILSHTKSGDEIILSELSHVIQHEAGAVGLLSRVQTRAIIPANGRYLTAQDVASRIRAGKDIHYPSTGLITYEQATATGNMVPISVMAEVHELADKWGVPVHIDGARFFNAAGALGVEPALLASYADSVTFCLSKGLSAPVGSVLVGSKAFIDRARKNRKIMGGGMRQAGFLAAAGLVALDTMRPQLIEDHRNARRLAEGLGALPGIKVDHMPDINLVFMEIKHPDMSSEQFVAALAEQGVLTYPQEDGLYRFVTHYGIDQSDIEQAIAVVRNVLRGH